MAATTKTVSPLNGKRAVLVHANGMSRIMGVFNEQEHELRPEIGVDFGSRVVNAGLVKVDKRRIVYKEIAA